MSPKLLALIATSALSLAAATAHAEQIVGIDESAASDIQPALYTRNGPVLPGGCQIFLQRYMIDGQIQERHVAVCRR